MLIRIQIPCFQDDRAAAYCRVLRDRARLWIRCCGSQGTDVGLLSCVCMCVCVYICVCKSVYDLPLAHILLLATKGDARCISIDDEAREGLASALCLAVGRQLGSKRLSQAGRVKYIL